MYVCMYQGRFKVGYKVRIKFESQQVRVASMMMAMMMAMMMTAMMTAMMMIMMNDGGGEDVPPTPFFCLTVRNRVCDPPTRVLKHWASD